MADIRVFVSFPRSQTVFAGEELHCNVTFKNTAVPPGAVSPGARSPRGSLAGNGHALGNGSAERRLKMAVPEKRPERPERPERPARPSTAPRASSHKPSLSVGMRPPLPPPTPSTEPNGSAKHKHKRSISIVSIGSDAGSEAGRIGRGSVGSGMYSPATPQRPNRGHSRSASMQSVASQRSPRPEATFNSAAAARSRPSTPITESPVSMTSFSFPRRTSGPIVAQNARVPRPTTSRSESAKSFKFPAKPSTPTEDIEEEQRTHLLGDGVEGGDRPPIISTTPPDDPDPPDHVIAAHRISDETPRSSAEFYSLSNSTNETLVSEYDPKLPQRIVRPSTSASHTRRHSLLSIGARSQPDTLMMGYAQVLGHFILDGSLMQANIFGDVKRKAIVSGQMGGGVVGLESNKVDGGLLSGFGWGGFGGALTGFLGGNNVSSIAEMKHIAESRSIPIISTPQSILFVDLRLAPGESRTYSYKFTLPEGLPPSHKGKAIKIVYNLAIGTQRPGQSVQHPKVVEIPFRVFPNVEMDGSMRTHDLWKPHILLQDRAITSCLDDPQPQTPVTAKPPQQQESSLQDFLSYADLLLGSSSDIDEVDNHLAILSPSISTAPKRLSIFEDQPTSSRDAIELALLRGPGSGDRGNATFKIARNGRHVGNLSLSRPAYKLGEIITAVLEFTNCDVPCYHIIASLESSETVAPDIALRSASSIHRATRKIYWQHSETTLFTQRVVFTPTIPPTATPEFHTSGVSNTWSLRLEFITPASASSMAQLSEDGEEGATPALVHEDLLEQTYEDNRGALYEPRIGLRVESFDASIPVKVYPNGNAESVFGQRELKAAERLGYPV